MCKAKAFDIYHLSYTINHIINYSQLVLDVLNHHYHFQEFQNLWVSIYFCQANPSFALIKYLDSIFFLSNLHRYLIFYILFDTILQFNQVHSQMFLN